MKTLPKKFPKQFAYGKLVTLLFIKAMEATGHWKLHCDYDGTMDDILRKKDVAMLHLPTGKIIIWQVKGEKEASRSNPNLEAIYQVVEWEVEDRNHRAHEGWLHGDYEYIAFLAGNVFLCMKRVNLLKFAEETRLKTPKMDKWPKDNDIIPHQDYCRRNYREEWSHPNECINFVKLSDFLTIRHEKLSIPKEDYEAFRESIGKL